MTSRTAGLATLSAPERHRQIAGHVSRLVRGAPGWDVAAPVEGWTARDVVRHLTDWLPAFLESGAGIRLARGPAVDADPVAAWQIHTEAVQALLDDESIATRTLSNPHLGDVPLDRAIDQFYTSDVFLHSWDLARATGQDDTLDHDFCAVLLAGMEPIEELMRASGEYGPRVPVPDDADVQTQLVGFIGRDPGWRPQPS
jgi:uncharacterized protein (TIGR03086 family)